MQILAHLIGQYWHVTDACHNPRKRKAVVAKFLSKLSLESDIALRLCAVLAFISLLAPVHA